MARLILWWAIWTALITVFAYFVDLKTKKEVGQWVGRVARAGVATAIAIGLIVFLERL